MLSKIAWRNLWRNKLRSSVIIAALAIGIIGAILMVGYMSGMVNQRVNSAIANEISNIQIHNPAFLLNEEMKYLIPDAEEIKKKIIGIHNVKAVSLRLNGSAMAASANAGAGINIIGVIPNDEYRVSDLHNHIIKGKYLSNNQKIPAFIGSKLSNKLKLGIADKIIITIADSTGTITSGAFEIVGLYKTSNDQFDQSNVFVKREDLTQLAGFSSKDGNEIAISLSDNSKTAEVKDKLNIIFKKEIKNKIIIVQSWQEIQPMLESMIEMMNFFSYIFLVIILIALAFAITNTMLMAMIERTQELGMLMALGMNKVKIFKMILLETMFLSVIGALTGILISAFVVQYYSVHGLDLSSFAKGLNQIGYSSVIYFKVGIEFYFISVIVVIIFALLSGIPAALKALKLQPAVALQRDN